jgi:hypothetical protein
MWSAFEAFVGLFFELYGQGKENIKMSAWQALKKAH